MIILGNLLIGLGKLISFFISIANFLVLASVIMSWVSADPRNGLVQFVRGVTEPLYYRIRKYVPTVGMLDLSPIILIAALMFLDQLVANSLIKQGELFLTESLSLIR